MAVDPHTLKLIAQAVISQITDEEKRQRLIIGIIIAIVIMVFIILIPIFAITSTIDTIKSFFGFGEDGKATDDSYYSLVEMHDTYAPTPQIGELEYNGTFPMPVQNATVTSEFGSRVHPVTGKQSFHTGIDLAGAWHSNITGVERTISKNKNSKVILGKTTKTYAGTRQLPIPKFLRGYIMEQMKIAKQSGYNVKLLFRNSLGNIANPAQVNTAFKETIKKLGFTDVTSHTLRHTFATRCIEGGMKPVVLQRLMGHTNIQITLNTYTSVFNKYKESEITKVNDYYLNNNIISYAQKEICDYSVVCMKNEE